MSKFRFEDLEIWKLGQEIGIELYVIADMLEAKKKFRFAEQLNSAALSITNNIAEGSGSFSDKDFAHFLNSSRRSVFETANILATLLLLGHIQPEQKELLYQKLDHLSSMIVNFRKSLLR
jgi:four helix bundle protein